MGVPGGAEPADTALMKQVLTRIAQLLPGG
jgi:hypothetical protein